MVISKVIFEIKRSVGGWSDQVISFSTKEIKSVLINIKGTRCELSIDGNNEEENLKNIIVIWEILVWEDGYFYRPIHYYVEDSEKSVDALISINCRITDKKWISSAILLCRAKRQIDENIIDKYKQIRYLDRKKQSMNASMFSSYFYLLSESYSNVNLEHRLVLLMHVCDGFAIQYCNGSSSNNSGNINIILRKIDAKKFKEGALLLGVSSSRAIEALGDTRNELTHYIYKQGSLGSFISNPDTETDNMVNLYAFYVLGVALRIAVLETIGVNVTDEIKNYVMDEHLDWIKLEKHLDEDCVLPMNVFCQMMEKFQKREQNPSE